MKDLYKIPDNQKKYIPIGLVVIFLLAAGKTYLSPSQRTNELKNKVPAVVFMGKESKGEWREVRDDEFIPISRSLNLNHISGCGEYYVIETGTGEYVTACTRDGINFNYYAVWPRIEKATRVNPADLVLNKLPKGSAQK